MYIYIRDDLLFTSCGNQVTGNSRCSGNVHTTQELKLRLKLHLGSNTGKLVLLGAWDHCPGALATCWFSLTALLGSHSDGSCQLVMALYTVMASELRDRQLQCTAVQGEISYWKA